MTTYIDRRLLLAAGAAGLAGMATAADAATPAGVVRWAKRKVQDVAGGRKDGPVVEPRPRSHSEMWSSS